MKITVTILALCLLGACGDADSDLLEGSSNMSKRSADLNESSEIIASVIEANDLTIDSKWHEAGSDSLEVLLNKNIEQFMMHLQSNNFGYAQELLHPEGLYYYTHGRIEPEKFNLQTLNEKKGSLRGAQTYTIEYEMGIDSVITGLFWLDSLRYNYTNKKPDWDNTYRVMAYGFTGNYCSDHIHWVDDWPNTPDSIKVHVAYVKHNAPEIDHKKILMIEFFEDKNGEWKIYAIGNLEWTP